MLPRVGHFGLYRSIALVIMLAALVAIALKIRLDGARAAVLRADPERILIDPSLRKTALEEGRPIFERYCASCHGETGKENQQMGVPDLTDDEYLYASQKVADIEQIVRYGIRAHNKRGWNLAFMPAYASAVPYKLEPLPSLNPSQIEELTQFVMSFTGRATDMAAARRGRLAFQTTAGCWDCHGAGAEGDPAIGAPALSDDVWLYGGGHDAIYRSIARGRAGYSPAFAGALSPGELRAVAVYVASLAKRGPTQKMTP